MDGRCGGPALPGTGTEGLTLQRGPSLAPWSLRAWRGCGEGLSC